MLSIKIISQFLNYKRYQIFQVFLVFYLQGIIKPKKSANFRELYIFTFFMNKSYSIFKKKKEKLYMENIFKILDYFDCFDIKVDFIQPKLLMIQWSFLDYYKRNLKLFLLYDYEISFYSISTENLFFFNLLNIDPIIIMELRFQDFF